MKGQDIKYSSDFVSPLKNIISGYVPDRYKRSCSATEQANEKEKINSGWLDNFFWNHNPVNILKGDLLERENALKDSGHAFKFGSQLKKYFSACNLQFCNIFEQNYITFKKGNHKSAENISHCESKNCEVPVKQRVLTKKINSFAPSVKKCSDHGPLLNSKRSRSQSNGHLRNDFLRPFTEISDNASRSFTTLRAKPDSAKSIVRNPSSATRNLQPSADNISLLADRGPIASNATERDSSILYDRLKKRDFDWINSFSSEAVILQPSRGEFSIKKLINKTTSQERLWGLPPRQSYAKTLGPRMNDNLVQYTALKHKMQSEYKKNHLLDENADTNLQVKKLIKSAKEKNRQIGLKKNKNVSAKYSARNVLKTIKETISLKPIDILKNKEKTAKNNEVRHFQKAHQQRSILNFRLPSAKVKVNKKEVLHKEKPLSKPSITEYQSSASYKHVFQELFSKVNKTKPPPKPALSFFNRQQTSKKSLRPASKLSYNLTRKEKVLKRKEPSSSALGRNRTVNLKNQARTPFQKPSNTQHISKSIASFSTVSKIPKMTGTPLVRHPKLLKNTRNTAPLLKFKTSERSISNNPEEGSKPIIKRTLYTTLGYYPPIPKRIEIKTKKKSKTKKNYTTLPEKNETKKEIKSNTQSTNSNNGFYNQRRSLSSLGMQIGTIMEVEKSVKTVTEPLNEQIFKEVMRLCKEKPAEKKKMPISEKERQLKRYGRCSLNERKKPERRRGFVCRIASMLNIGCGRRRRLNQGCSECGKKAG